MTIVKIGLRSYPSRKSVQLMRECSRTTKFNLLSNHQVQNRKVLDFVERLWAVGALETITVNGIKLTKFKFNFEVFYVTYFKSTIMSKKFLFD